NPALTDLVGGIQSAALGDEEARRRGTQKAILERRAPPTFNVLVESQSFSKVAVHADVAEVVDAILRGYSVPPEIRELDATGQVRLGAAVSHTAASARDARGRADIETTPAATRQRRVYPV